MNACTVANEKAHVALSQQDPGESSSELREGDASPKKMALHHHSPNDKEETDMKIANSKDHKALIQGIVNDGKTGPTVTRRALGVPPTTDIPTLPSLKVSNNNSLNDVFREYRKSLANNDQGNHPKVQPTSKGQFGNKFVRTISKIRDQRKTNRQERMVEYEKKMKETRSNVGSSSDKTCEKSQADLEESKTHGASHEQPQRERRIVKAVVKDFSSEGDQKILRAIQRSAVVNAAVLATSLTGGVTGAAGLLTGGAIAAKRLGDGVQQEDEREVAKSLAVYGSSTTASFVGQVATGALLVGVAGTTVPVAGAVAFGVGCASGITAGALSEWGVDHALREEDQDTDHREEVE